MQARYYRRDRWTAALLRAAVLPAMVSLGGCQTAGMKSEAGAGASPSAAVATDEARSWGAAPTDTYRTREMSAPTPDAVAGATVVTTDALLKMMQEPVSPVVFDVLNRTYNVPGALLLEGAGKGTGVDDDLQAKFAAAVEQATEGDKGRRVVFLCKDARCWLSHNATLRALALGYEDVYWYRGGVAAWKAAGLPTVQPTPGW